MTAAGRVCTGFSKPYVALYSASAGTVTYTSGQVLARGVEVKVDPTSSDTTEFYADNQSAESAGGKFTGGTATLTVDGLHPTARKLINGLPTAGSDGWTPDGDETNIPYVAIGYIARFQSDGEEIFVPTILTKTKLSPVSEDFATQEDAPNFQPQDLEFNLHRDDTASHNWKFIGGDFETEPEAETALRTKLSITSTQASTQSEG